MHDWFMISRQSLKATVFAALVAGSAQAATLRLNARKIFSHSVSSNVTLSQDGSAVELTSGAVYQDDGPASGFSYKPNREALSPGIEIRKQLLIPDPRTSEALLMVSDAGNLKVQVNGTPQDIGPLPKARFGEWQAYHISPAALKPGMNEADGGRDWSVDRLGPAGDIAGEYYIRLYLKQFLSSGSLLLPVMDVADLDANPLAPPVTGPGPIRVSVSTSPGSGSGVTLRVRSGTTYVPSPETWSDWEPLDRDGSIRAPHGRFFQVAVTLFTTNPLVTPRLRGITLTTEPKIAKDWTTVVKVVHFHDEEIVRTSIPFRYEPFTQPKLKELRTRYHLDEVVRGAHTDLGIITRLAAWTSRQWKWGEWHLDEYYPPWDALAILERQPDGRPVGGFCQQYNVVLLQAAESLGFVGRDVSISSGTLGRPTAIGHEAVEIWSNQFRKWIWIDGFYGFYAQDSATRVPPSLWEIRQRQLKVLRGENAEPTRIVHFANTPLLPTMPLWLKATFQWSRMDADMSFAELRLIPRSNFLEQESPLPLNNGKLGWNWTGFDVWTDANAPAEPIYPNLITRHGNFEWTLNQAHFVLEPTSRRGEFLVHLDTMTPGFETFLAEIDGGKTSPAAAIFLWKLHAGRNRLKVWPRNDAGCDGIASWIELEMPQM